MSKDDTHYRVWVGLSGLRQQLSGLVARVQDVLSAGAFDGYVRAADLLLVSAY